MGFSSSDGFSTSQMVQAERELDGRINFAFSRAQQVRAKIEEIDEKLAKDSEPPTNEEVERFKAYILGHARTEEWQVVIDRIGRGELSWRQIVDGVAEGRFDRDVSAAMASLTRVPPATMESLVSIGVLPDLNKAAQDTEDTEDTADAKGAEKDRGRAVRKRPDDDDDDWFENQSFMVRR